MADSLLPGDPNKLQALKFPKTYKVEKVLSGNYYVEKKVERTPSEINKIKEDFKRESDVYKALDPRKEA